MSERDAPPPDVPRPDAPAPDNAGVIAPPPLIFATVLAIGVAIDLLLYRVRTGLPDAVRYVIAALLLFAAVALIAGALLRFRAARTNPMPWRPTTAIVSDGVFAFTRNPMYLAMALAYVALSLAVDSVIALALVPLLLALVHYGVIAREERYLSAKFGEPYRRYLASVRRWV